MRAASYQKIHAVLFWFWVANVPLAATLWKESVPYLVAVSVYANLATHWAAWQATRAEEERNDGN